MPATTRRPRQSGAVDDTERFQPRRAQWLPVLALIAVGLLAVICMGIAVAAPGGAVPGTFRYELMQTCLQVIGIAVLGACVSLAVFRLQQYHLEQSKRIWRDRDLEIDRRTRLDDRIHAFLQETIDAYHGVKRIRRELESLSTRGHGDGSDYTRLMLRLSDRQLDFESLMWRSRELEPRVADIDPRLAAGSESSLQMCYKLVESYLNDLVDDYQKNREPAKVREFIKTAPFKAGVSTPVRTVIEGLERVLLTAGSPPEWTDDQAAPRADPAQVEQPRGPVHSKEAGPSSRISSMSRLA